MSSQERPAAETGRAATEHGGPPAILLSVAEALARRMPRGRKSRLTLAALGLSAVLIPSIALLILPIWFDLDEESLAQFGYVGVFVANLASTATVFIPVPGLTAAGQALILKEGDTLNPIVVGIAGGGGMALGEITAYLAGYYGGQAAQGRRAPGPEWVARSVERVIMWVDWLMGRYGMLTLFVLAAIPNPTFEFAGLAAGAERMSFARFMLAVTAGKVVRGITLAFLGAQDIDLPGL